MKLSLPPPVQSTLVAAISSVFSFTWHGSYSDEFLRNMFIVRRSRLVLVFTFSVFPHILPHNVSSHPISVHAFASHYNLVYGVSAHYLITCRLFHLGRSASPRLPRPSRVTLRATYQTTCCSSQPQDHHWATHRDALKATHQWGNPQGHPLGNPLGNPWRQQGRPETEPHREVTLAPAVFIG